MDYSYDENNKKSIEKYARKLIDKSLSSFNIDENNSRLNNKKSKGRLGNLVEEEYFGYKINNKQESDFSKVGVELKVCPIKTVKKKPKSTSIKEKIGYSAKERIVLSIIDYFKLNNEQWENNSLMKKCKELLLMFYMNEKDVPKEELKFKIISLWTPSNADLKVIENDWKLISSKVKMGKAHEISEGDTMYLGACTKGNTAEKSRKHQPNSDVLAPQRAFCYKRAYVDYIIEELMLSEEHREKEMDKHLSDNNMIFDERIYYEFNKMINRSLFDIMQEYKINRERKAKNFTRLVIDDICKSIFGDKLENFQEFKKSNIEIKTIMLKPNGTPKESMSFEQIDYCNIIDEEWDNSTIKNKFENKKHLWIIFKSNKNFTNQCDLSLDDIMLYKVMFWNMPISDLDNSMNRVWMDTTNKIKNGIYNDFIKISDGEIAHIRFKGKNSNDLAVTPQGTKQRKRCFWLNAKYIKQQIDINDVK
ncbi:MULTISPECIES: Sau3AI family type II restriction endonuclease [Clostridium]|uniref:Sau3AI family type II restriction endonuclease n=1 Tax=Clostridium TaxID=1485 RepID=UPI0004D7C927|nr:MULTISPECIES: Sau3AI family type II restriction endonuclease [Clostridium]KEH85270.1 DNA mismatch repair protein MutH [Clostridium novyi A str. 4540]KEH92320.1 DNA mismatch repair protein MutH [Clostridium botulinum C/D str. It1]